MKPDTVSTAGGLRRSRLPARTRNSPAGLLSQQEIIYKRLFLPSRQQEVTAEILQPSTQLTGTKAGVFALIPALQQNHARHVYS